MQIEKLFTTRIQSRCKEKHGMHPFFVFKISFASKKLNLKSMHLCA